MKLRLVTAVALSAGLFLSVSGAEAATPTMDGKKLKAINVTAKATLQSNDKDFVVPGGPERVDCKAPRCSKTSFVYKPAKGVKGGLLLTATWANTASDIDLYLAVVNPNKSLTQVGACGASAGTSEKVYVPPSTLRSGKTYIMVIDFYRTNAEVVKGKVEINVSNSTKTTVPAKAEDALISINCGL